MLPSDLPPLPEPDAVYPSPFARLTIEDQQCPPISCWLEKSMRAYALAARAERDAEIERWKEIVESLRHVSSQLAQRDERIRELEAPRVGESIKEAAQRKRAETAEAEVLRLRTGFQTATVDLVAAEARIKELQQSAEVHARNMRDLVAEHVREREALSERVRELEDMFYFEVERLQCALSGWLPQVRGDGSALDEQAAKDAFLLIGMEGEPAHGYGEALRSKLEATEKNPT